MTFTILRSLHAIIGDALNEMEQVYRSQGYDPSSMSASTRKSPENASSTLVNPQLNNTELDRAEHKSSLPISHAYASPPPSPLVATCSESVAAGLDFPSLDTPFDPTSPSEALTSHPTVMAAISRIIAAAGQLSASVQTPFLTLCDATMGVRWALNYMLVVLSDILDVVPPSLLHETLRGIPRR